MKKQLIAIFCVLMISIISTNIFAEWRECSPDDNATNNHGCKNLYTVPGMIQPRMCNPEDYATNNHGCKDKYWVQTTITDPGYNEGKVNGQLKTVAQQVWATVTIIVQIVAVGCVVFAGLRYMFASADQRADIKGGLIRLAIGAVLVFSAITIIHFVVDAASQIM